MIFPTDKQHITTLSAKIRQIKCWLAPDIASITGKKKSVFFQYLGGVVWIVPTANFTFEALRKHIILGTVVHCPTKTDAPDTNGGRILYVLES